VFELETCYCTTSPWSNKDSNAKDYNTESGIISTSEHRQNNQMALLMTVVRILDARLMIVVVGPCLLHNSAGSESKLFTPTGILFVHVEGGNDFYRTRP
jgi:hypothetical protein